MPFRAISSFVNHFHPQNPTKFWRFPPLDPTFQYNFTLFSSTLQAFFHEFLGLTSIFTDFLHFIEKLPILPVARFLALGHILLRFLFSLRSGACSASEGHGHLDRFLRSNSTIIQYVDHPE